MSKSAIYFIYGIISFLLSGCFLGLFLKDKDFVLLAIFLFSQFLGVVCLILSSRAEPNN